MVPRLERRQRDREAGDSHCLRFIRRRVGHVGDGDRPLLGDDGLMPLASPLQREFPRDKSDDRGNGGIMRDSDVTHPREDSQH
jgi:hypothetical protein